MRFTRVFVAPYSLNDCMAAQQQHFSRTASSKQQHGHR
jgi:hypothetical protein